MIGQQSGQVVLEIYYCVDQSIEQARRELQVAMVCQHGRLAEETSAEGYSGRVELWQMHLDDIVLPNQFGSNPAKSRRDDAFAEAEYHWYTDNLNTIQCLLARQGLIILGGHHGHFVAALRKSPRQSFGVNGKTGCVRAVVGENSENFHIAGEIITPYT